jgi:tRNA A-37 threonylcarbamoyl transferase component Bud32
VRNEQTLVAKRYRLLRRLGAGAMGAVYEALDLETERRRAIKVMHAHTLDRPDLRERFQLEARVAGRVASPFLVDVLDAGVDDDGTPFLVMELLRGEDLRARLDRLGRFPPAEALRYVEQIALALDRIHAARIVHRDLKPGNLFLEEREHEAPRIKVLDFGIAKLVEQAAPSDTTSTAGTPPYMAPEQFRGRGITRATDVYALGMIAFTFLVGVPYWEEEHAGARDLVGLALVAVEGPKDPASTRAARRGVELQAGFDGWFARATAVDPGRRFESAGAAARALAEALGVPSGLPAEESAESRGQGRAGSALGEADTELASDERDGAVESGETAAQPSNVPAVVTRTETSPDEGPGSKDAGPPPEAPGAAPVPRRARWAPALLLVGAAAVALYRWPIRSSPPNAVTAALPGPLARPSSVLACPIFESSGVEEPAGWLGAAAAGVLCARAQSLLGGSTARTLIPAELLSLPVQPVDRFPEDPYAAADARARTIEAARRRAAAYVDGQVVKDGSGFRVSVVLRSPDGGEAGHGEGRGRALYEAVRGAMLPLVDGGALPKAAGLDPTVAAFSSAPDVDAALALGDLGLAMTHNAGGLAEECARVEARAADLGAMGPGERYRCAYTLGLPTPDVDLPPARPSSPGPFAARVRVLQMVKRTEDPESLAELEGILAREASPWARSVLASTASCLVQSRDPRRAADLALLAVQAEPKNPTGEFCAPWIQLISASRGTATAGAVLRAMQAWTPWDGYAWLSETLGGSDTAALRYARRAYTLSPLDTYIADTLADRLLASGAREEARGIALSVATGAYPVHRLESDLIRLRVDASEARFGAALSRGRDAMVPSPTDGGLVLAQRIEAAWRAIQVGLVLGRAPEIADLAVARFLDPDPPPLEALHMVVPLRLPALCAYASPKVSARCFDRLRALRGRLVGGIQRDTDAFSAGAERWARGDFAGAARAFRPLLREPALFVAELDGPMVETFEHTGETDLVLRLEAAVADRAKELNGASLAVVRAARRAGRAGDREKARALAKQVVEAWAVADEAVPAVEEMRRLLRGSGGR